MMELVSEAIIFAAKAHDGMRRKLSEAPYILHPLEAAAIVGTVTSEQEVIAAAVLHDVVEDAGIPIEEIEAHFGKRVTELVASETEDKRAQLPAESTWKLRKGEAIEILSNTEDLGIKALYLGDKLSNLRSIYLVWREKGDAVWKNFNEKDPAQQAWYYRGIADNIQELSGTLAYQEFNRLIQTMFKEISI